MISRIFLLVIFSSYISTNAQAEHLIIGVEDLNYYPIYHFSQGQYTGAASEIINHFAKLNNHTVTYKSYPITRLNKQYLTGELDFRFPDNAYWAQEQKSGYEITYSNSVIDFIDGVMVLPSNQRKEHNQDTLKKLGTVRGFTAWDYLERIKNGSIKINETTNLSSLIKRTMNGRDDGAYFNIDVAYYFLNNTLNKPQALIFDPNLPHTKSSYSLSSFKRPAIIKQFNQFLIEQADWINNVKLKYQIKSR